MNSIERAAAAIRSGALVVYPTETVYGLAADALSPAAIERAFEAKGRARGRPLSMAVPDGETAREYTRLTERERAFVERFLPGPVTVVVERGPELPDELTGGRDRVGIRIPDHPVALALLAEVAPITATSANRSGGANARRAEDLDPTIRERSEVVLDGGTLAGTESTVVDVEMGEIHRQGEIADEVEQWLADH
ncbi:L-threonylcarbamoyladenylate synthase [Natronorarus salvus]|uniref:L-threonylcarbamoyladenylate synthase n=1 Tax=Natronorarus salvus TaxID=3117733 RepID=UPI002F266224